MTRTLQLRDGAARLTRGPRLRLRGPAILPRIDASDRIETTTSVAFQIDVPAGVVAVDVLGPSNQWISLEVSEGETSLLVNLADIVGDPDEIDVRAVPVELRFRDADNFGPSSRVVLPFVPDSGGEAIIPIALAVPGSLTANGASTVYAGAPITRVETVFSGTPYPGSFSEVMQVSTDEGDTFTEEPFWEVGPDPAGAWARPVAQVSQLLADGTEGDVTTYTGEWLRSEEVPDLPALTDEDVTVAQSVIRPAGSATFSPLVEFPGIETPVAADIEWTTSEDQSVANPVEHIGDGVFVLRSWRGNPVPPGETDLSNFTATDVRLADRLRFRHRADDASPWSPWSEPFDVPLPDAAPEAVEDLPDLVYAANDAAQTFDIASKFSGVALSFSVTGSARVVVTEDGALTITPGATALGATTITVTGTNDFGSVSLTFTLTVTAAVAAPVLILELPDRSIAANAASVTIDLNQHFSGATSYTVAGSAAASVAGAILTIVPPGAPTGPVNVTVTAINAGGGTPDTFALTITAALSSPVLVSPLPDFVVFLGAADVTYDASQHFSGATSYTTAGVGRLTIHPTTGLITIAPWDTALAPKSATITAHNAQGDTPATTRVTVAAGGDPKLAFVPEATINQGPNAAAQLFTLGLSPFQVQRDRGLGMGIPVKNSTQAFHALTTIALVAYSGDTTAWPIGGGNTITARQLLINNLKNWANGAQTAPAASMGYNGQYEMRAVTAIGIASRIPGIFGAGGALTNVEQERLDLVMLGQFISSCTVASASFPAGWTGWGVGKERTIRGFASGWNQNPNYSTTTKLFPSYVAMYFAFRNPLPNGTPNFNWAQNWLNAFDANVYKRFVARCGPAGVKTRDTAASGGAFIKDAGGTDIVGIGGLSDLYDTFLFRWNGYADAQPQFPNALRWTNAEQNRQVANPEVMGDGWSLAQIVTALTGETPWRDRQNFSLAQFDARWQSEVDRCFGKVIKPGLVGHPGAEAAPGGSGWTGNFGIKQATTQNRLRGCFGKPMTPGNTNSDTNKSCWALIPFKNQTGLCWEMDTGDAGGPRSSYNYGADVSMATAALLGAMCAYGVLDTASPGWIEKWGQVDRGTFICAFIHAEGYRSHAKGGITVANSNSDCDAAWADAQGMRWRSWCGSYTNVNTRVGLHRMMYRYFNGIN